jgi:hypothetical protein
MPLWQSGVITMIHKAWHEHHCGIV